MGIYIEYGQDIQIYKYRDTCVYYDAALIKSCAHTIEPLVYLNIRKCMKKLMMTQKYRSNAFNLWGRYIAGKEKKVPRFPSFPMRPDVFHHDARVAHAVRSCIRDRHLVTMWVSLS